MEQAGEQHESRIIGRRPCRRRAGRPGGAQEVIYNPGYCAQFYPNANCQNKGPGNPYTGYRRSGWHNGYAWAARARGGTGIIVIIAGIDASVPRTQRSV